MFYKKFYIKNYKGVVDVELDLTNNKIFSLVGLNESGKTTILEAISLFYRLIKGETLSQAELYKIRPKGPNFTGTIEVSAELEFEKKDYIALDKYLKDTKRKTKLKYPKIFWYSFEFDYSLNEHYNTDSHVNFQAKIETSGKKLYSANNALWNVLVEFINDRLMPEILYYEDFIFEVPDKISYTINSVPPNDNVHETEWRFIFDDIIMASSNLKNYSFQQGVVDIWKRDNDTARQRLALMEKQLDDKITKAWKELFDSDTNETNHRVNFKEIKILAIPDENGTISFSFRVKTDNNKEFSIDERSKGCQWFFSFLIFTEFRKNRTENILFLLDEPASNLHSSAQLKILEAIESLSDKSIIIYSTHSHHLINPKWLNGAYVVINEAISEDNLEGNFTNEDTNISVEKYYHYVSRRHQRFQPLYFQPILDRLDYRRSFVEPMPKITICEGKNDWYTFLYIKTLLPKEYNFNFYPGKGAGNNFDIIRLYLSWGGDFLLITDGDKAGEKAVEKYKEEFDGLLDDKVFTLANIIKRKVAMEELFTENDKKIICDTAFGKGTYEGISDSKQKLKSTFNYAINQLLIKKTRVELDSNTINTFDTIFNFIELKHQD